MSFWTWNLEWVKTFGAIGKEWMYFTSEEDMNSAGSECRALEQIEALTHNVTVFED